MACAVGNKFPETSVEEYSGKSVMYSGLLPSPPSQCIETRTENALADLKQQTIGQSWRWSEPPFEDTKQKAMIEVEVKYANSGSEIGPYVLFTLQILYTDGHGFVYGVSPGDAELGLSIGDQILSINDMSVTGWSPLIVTEILEILVNKNKCLSLIIQSSSGTILKFSLNLAESKCEKEVRNGWDFMKNLDILPGSFKQTDCFLIHEQTGLCVVSDGQQVHLETLHKESPSLTSAWQCLGTENDPESVHYQTGRMIVFGFKLKHSNSDSSKCLGVAHKDALILVDADIPDHGIVLPTKLDCRFFYGIPLPPHYLVFESTIFERHYLAVSKVNGKVALILKECPTNNKKPITDAEIIFKCTTRNGNDSILSELLTSDNQWV